MGLPMVMTIKNRPEAVKSNLQLISNVFFHD